MAAPRVFVSSTCYDLGEVRDSLVEFIRGFGFEPILSERGDVFYHPDLHTHESCVKEVANCHVLILVIGGRFGGAYVADSTKSIVNAEYSAARALQLPVFTFIKSAVLENHFVYQKNKSSAAEIIYPAIENQEHATKIFDFIDEVRSSPTNNGFFRFDFGKDIQSSLRKQWAGMLFEHLLQRKNVRDHAEALSVLSSISNVSEKIEDLVKKLYLHTAPAEAPKEIAKADELALAKSFFSSVINYFKPGRLKSNDLQAAKNPKASWTWVDYMLKFRGFRVSKGVGAMSGGKIDCLNHKATDYIIAFAGDMDVDHKKRYSEYEKKFEAFKNLPSRSRAEVLNEFLNAEDDQAEVDADSSN